MEDYFSGEFVHVKCKKCGKTEMKLICSISDHTTNLFCEECRNKVMLP